jgi:hypothetical protein
MGRKPSLSKIRILRFLWRNVSVKNNITPTKSKFYVFYGEMLHIYPRNHAHIMIFYAIFFCRTCCSHHAPYTSTLHGEAPYQCHKFSSGHCTPSRHMWNPGMINGWVKNMNRKKSCPIEKKNEQILLSKLGFSHPERSPSRQCPAR